VCFCWWCCSCRGVVCVIYFSCYSRTMPRPVPHIACSFTPYLYSQSDDATPGASHLLSFAPCCQPAVTFDHWTNISADCGPVVIGPSWLSTKQESSPERLTGCDHPNCPPRTTRATSLRPPMGFELCFVDSSFAFTDGRCHARRRVLRRYARRGSRRGDGSERSIRVVLAQI